MTTGPPAVAKAEMTWHRRRIRRAIRRHREGLTQLPLVKRHGAHYLLARA
jgi:hypothetical protein